MIGSRRRRTGTHIPGSSSAQEGDAVKHAGGQRRRFEPPRSSSYLTALAHSSGEQRVLQADVQAPAGDADVCRQSACLRRRERS